MNFSVILASFMLVATVAVAQEESAPETATQTPAAAEAAPESPAKPEAQPSLEAPEASQTPEAPAKAEPPQEPKAQEEAAASKPQPKKKTATPQEILTGRFEALKSAAEGADSGLREAALEGLRTFVEQNPGAAEAPEAFSILAAHEDWRPALVDWLHMVYEYPGSRFAQKAKSEYLEIVSKRAKSRLQPALRGLLQPPAEEDKARRLAHMVCGLAENTGDAAYEPVVDEARRFLVRFPAFAETDRVLWSLALAHAAAGKSSRVLMAYRQLLAYAGSPYREKAFYAVGELYADRFKLYHEAVDSFQAFIEEYPQSGQVLPALERMALLYADRLKQPLLAVETYERIIKRVPKTEAALRAFNEEASLQRSSLKAPEDAVKTYERLAAQFGYPQAVQALLGAATVCRKDLKDYQREVSFRRKIADDFPTAKEAPEQLYEAAQVTEGDLGDIDGAIKLYLETVEKFAAHKLGRKAGARAEKLQSKRGP